jgi:hypothetical protein
MRDGKFRIRGEEERPLLVACDEQMQKWFVQFHEERESRQESSEPQTN